MERIENLLSKLKTQFDQKADASVLLETVHQLQNELQNQLQPRSARVLGTSKVAVMMPSGAGHISPEYERYAPRPAAEPAKETKEIKETVLVDKGSVAIVKDNGQLDMVFDPLMEIPTLSQQVQEINTARANSRESESLNDKLKQGKTELLEVLKETPVKDLRKAIGVNDRFLFIDELFRGDEAMYERSIKTINSFNIHPEAEYWITRELKTKLGWNNENSTVQHFDQIVRRRFS